MNTDTKERAEVLVNLFKDYVNPYIGSGMLSNDIDDRAILAQSKKCATIAVNFVIRELTYTIGDWPSIEKRINNFVRSEKRNRKCWNYRKTN